VINQSYNFMVIVLLIFLLWGRFFCRDDIKDKYINLNYFFYFPWAFRKWTWTRSLTSCLRTGAKMSNCSSLKSEGSVSNHDRFSCSSQWCWSWKHQLKYVVCVDLCRRHSWTVPWSHQTLRIRWLPRRDQLSIPRRLCRPWKTVHLNHLLDACIQNQKPRKLLHAQRQPRMLKH